MYRRLLQLSMSASDSGLPSQCRRERAELEAGSLSDDDGGGGSPVGLSAVIAEEEPVTAGIPYEKNMLEESRRVEEYERLNRISGQCGFMRKYLSRICVFHTF